MYVCIYVHCPIVRWNKILMCFHSAILSYLKTYVYIYTYVDVKIILLYNPATNSYDYPCVEIT